MSTQQRDLIAAEVRAAVARKNIKLGQLAEAIGMNPNVLRRKLNGTSPFGMEELTAVARAIGVPPATLINAALVAAAA